MTLINDQLLSTLRGLRDVPPDQWTLLPAFTFSVAHVAGRSGQPEALVRTILDAFMFPNDGNPTFTALQEFNAVNAFPLNRAGEGRYILFQYSSLAEALYDTPFYWMAADDKYEPAAMDHRGRFTEEFAVERLKRVFGKDRIFRGVHIWQSKGKELGEIDALVLLPDRAIVLQAKSKKLTIAARKGNDKQLQTDFKAAVQDASDQAISCSQALLSGNYTFTDASGNEIAIPKGLKEVYPLCVVSDHYPALAFQARQFLKHTAADPIKAPLVCDVFFLDTVTEMLDRPLRFLSFLELRAKASESLLMSHESSALGFHLRRNLWIGEADLVHLGDDIAADLDIAMAVRRDGVDGQATPPGILTALEGTTVGRIIDQIEASNSSPAFNVGLQLLKLSTDAALDLSRGVEQIAAAAARDGGNHDITLVMGQAASGLTVHCNASGHLDAALSLRRHCELRKYGQRASSWFGMVVEPGTGTFRLGLSLEYPWTENADLERAAGRMGEGIRPEAFRRMTRRSEDRPKAVPNNAPCPCGSGRKYKRCCIPKER